MARTRAQKMAAQSSNQRRNKTVNGQDTRTQRTRNNVQETETICGISKISNFVQRLHFQLRHLPGHEAQYGNVTDSCGHTINTVHKINETVPIRAHGCTWTITLLCNDKHISLQTIFTSLLDTYLSNDWQTIEPSSCFGWSFRSVKNLSIHMTCICFTAIFSKRRKIGSL